MENSGQLYFAWMEGRILASWNHSVMEGPPLTLWALCPWKHASWNWEIMYDGGAIETTLTLGGLLG